MYVFPSSFCIPLVKDFIICPLKCLLSSFFCFFNTFLVTKVIFLANHIIILPKCTSDLSFSTSNTLTAPVAYRCSEQLSVGFKMLHHVAPIFPFRHFYSITSNFFSHITLELSPKQTCSFTSLCLWNVIFFPSSLPIELLSRLLCWAYLFPDSALLPAFFGRERTMILGFLEAPPSPTNPDAKTWIESLLIYKVATTGSSMSLLQ